jgi:hypothetical protein
MRARGKTKRIPDGEAAGVNIEHPTSNNHHRKPTPLHGGKAAGNRLG